MSDCPTGQWDADGAPLDARLSCSAAQLALLSCPPEACCGVNPATGEACCDDNHRIASADGSSLRFLPDFPEERTPNERACSDAHPFGNLGCLSYTCVDCDYPHTCDGTCPQWCGVGASAQGAVTPPSATDADKPQQTGLSLWAQIVLPVAVVLLLGPALWWAHRCARSRRSAVAVIAAAIVALLCLASQGLVAFRVGFDVPPCAGDAFGGDFWAGANELRASGSAALAVLVGGLSGAWPIIKQGLTAWTVAAGQRSDGRDPTAQRETEIRRLRTLGVLGKTAFFDVAFVACVVALLTVDGLPPDGTGLLFSAPQAGATLVVCCLLASRALTSGLVNVWPPCPAALSTGAGEPAKQATPKI